MKLKRAEFGPSEVTDWPEAIKGRGAAAYKAGNMKRLGDYPTTGFATCWTLGNPQALSKVAFNSSMSPGISSTGSQRRDSPVGMTL
jgi:hypothetical protein